ncbi:hypothetical protein [Pelagibacterium luteolum]|uniref:Uncharacterized protein n=1 Tax=Pelagibacterium luteolum TaxID=440168 RepID=A0A1G7VD11_9HYPH|nr:hypothetical protein [Pelagibacterium luteolum]SDG57239.1 hypothetical protein SAMN04487974_10444 [Pelagibacterium luteolum]
MWKYIRRFFVEQIYPDPRTSEGEPPAYLSLREMADLPPYHPNTARCPKD